jgi:hypothetical protein
MAATENPTVDPTNLPRRIRQNHSSDDPWYEHNGEPLFGDAQSSLRSSDDGNGDSANGVTDDTDWVRRRVTQIAEANDVGSYSPRNGFRKKTKIRTKDIEEFDEALADRIADVDSEFEFIMLPKLKQGVDVREKGPQRTDVSFSPNFGRRVGLGGAEHYRNQILTEVLCYEVEVFWERVLQPVFKELADKYPY